MDIFWRKYRQWIKIGTKSRTMIKFRKIMPIIIKAWYPYYIVILFGISDQLGEQMESISKSSILITYNDQLLSETQNSQYQNEYNKNRKKYFFNFMNVYQSCDIQMLATLFVLLGYKVYKLQVQLELHLVRCIRESPSCWSEGSE